MLEEIILPLDWQVAVDGYTTLEKQVILELHLITPKVACPYCGWLSRRVHSRYLRQPADLPIAGYTVQFRLTVRRLFCDNPLCSHRTFSEQVPSMLLPQQHRTARQATLLKEQAFALGGEAGARQLQKMGIAVSPDTLIRLCRTTPQASHPTPRVLGVDDFCFKRGLRYGTILVDLETHEVIDLLPDREANTLAEWLKAHLGVEVISRDRASAYAEGAKTGAPDAIQVADRFHLLQNLTTHLTKVFERKRACLYLSEPAPPPAPSPETVIKEKISVVPKTEKVIPAKPKKERLIPERRVYLWEECHRLKQAGCSEREIARALGCSRNTVPKYLRAKAPSLNAPRTPVPSKLDPYKPYLAERWEGGIYRGWQLFEEIKERGYRGSRALLVLYLADYGLTHPRKVATRRGGLKKSVRPKAPARPKLSRRQAIWLMVRLKEDLREGDQVKLAHLRQFDSEVEEVYQLSQTFVAMVKNQQSDKLEDWLKKALEGQAAELVSFARGIERDKEAVMAGLSLPYSQGQVEGQVNRLKLIKRMGYGRAGFELLKARVLYAA